MWPQLSIQAELLENKGFITHPRIIYLFPYFTLSDNTSIWWDGAEGSFNFKGYSKFLQNRRDAWGLIGQPGLIRHRADTPSRCGSTRFAHLNAESAGPDRTGSVTRCGPKITAHLMQKTRSHDWVSWSILTEIGTVPRQPSIFREDSLLF